MSDTDDAVTINTKGLDKLLSAFNGKIPVIRVGVMGDKNVRQGESSNATVGAMHEFGTSTLPIRSFLRVPLSEQLGPEMERAGALDKSVLTQVVASKSLMPWLQKIAVLAEKVVQDAFDSGGFGKWKPSNMNDKKNHQTLVETQQLRNSITSEVKT